MDSGRSRSSSDQSEGNKQQPKDSSDDTDKKKNKGRKNRNINKSQSESPSLPQKVVKIYSPLKIFDSLKIDEQELYRRYLVYVHTKDQLKMHGFPHECSNTPGRACVNGSPVIVEQKDPIQCKCCRCGKAYLVYKNGNYQAEEGCNYHWGRRVSLAGIAGPYVYTCCRQDAMSDGCTWSRLHVRSEFGSDHPFVKTRSKKNVRPGSSFGIFALDCEMCYTMKGMEVTKITVVRTDGLSVYDSYVLPESPIIDYNTVYSGITASDLNGVTTTLPDVQACLLKMFNSKTIVIGHGLENDLKGLRLIHDTVIDTSIVFPHKNGLPLRRSLKSLTTTYLNRTIQESVRGHDSAEDARACMELMLWKLQMDTKSAKNIASTILPPPLPAPSVASEVSWKPNTLAPSVFCVNSTLLPYQYGYWVPPVGSQMELY